jgi:hypothetical protein
LRAQHAASCSGGQDAAALSRRTAIAIGWHARKQWLALDETARHGHTYIEAFKLALHDPTRAAMLPHWLTAEQVGAQTCSHAVWVGCAEKGSYETAPVLFSSTQAVGDYLSLLRAYAMDVFDDKYGSDPSPPTEDTIMW